MKKYSGILLITLLVLAALLSACVVATPAPAQPAEAPATEAEAPAAQEEAAPAAGEAATSWFAEAAKPYAGVTIRGISESTPPSRYAQEELAKAFEAETGIKVEFEITSWDQMYDKPIKDMEANTGIYDFIYIEQDIIYTYLARDFLTDLTQMLNDNPNMIAPDFSVDNFTSFIDNFKDNQDHIFGVPMEAFIKIVLYRKDLFDNPDIQAAFKEQYGSDLAPATTFEEYQNIADFFTQYGQDNNMELWGTTVQGTTGHAASFYEYYETIAPSWGVYNWGISEVNPGNYKACEANGGSMNSDTAKEALAWWVGLLKDAPPEATSSTWDEVAATFAAGRAAQGWVYGENAAWIATDDTRSQVVGNVGVALPPVAPGVMDEAKAGTGYIGYYDGGAFGIPYSSKNKEAALLWLEYIGQPSVQANWAVAGARVVMASTFDDPKVKAQDELTDGYYTMLRNDGYLFRGAPPFPFHPQVREAVAPFIWQTLSGESTASDALDQACVAAEDELTTLGYSQ